MASEYPDHFVRRLEIIWGRGFMSPGGPEEVREILTGLPVGGARVLDIGCGIAGPDLIIAGELGAAEVVAVDVAENLVDHARHNVVAAGLGERIDCRLVEPGPLPFADATFDIVFSKDAFLHVSDKAALFGEVLRVLVPGGALAASDWLGGEDRDASPGWRAYQALLPYSFVPMTAGEARGLLAGAGFEGVATRDRNGWYAEIARRDLADAEGRLRADLVAASSETIVADWIRMRRGQVAAVEEGALRPTHLRGVRPSS